MKQLTTFDSVEHHNKLQEIYIQLNKIAQTAAIAHLQTLDKNNPYHFHHIIDEINATFDILKLFYPEYDKRKEEFPRFNKQNLIREAREFLNADPVSGF